MKAEVPVWLAGYGPQLPLPSLVERINVLFHSFAATSYDRDHPEINRQLPPLWAEMMALLPDGHCWNVLDLGCGTGFEADLLLSALGDRVARLTAYDPSEAMMAICRGRLQGRFPQVSYCSRLEAASSGLPFNLLLTNSLLHHLPDIRGTIVSLLPRLTPDAYWLAGHEPSTRFFRNRDCVELLGDYRRFRRRARWLDWKSYRTRLELVFKDGPLAATARMAFDQGLFLTRPTPELIDRLVDFQVARSGDEAGNGLEPDLMSSQLQPHWELQWSKTYAFLGPFAMAGVPSGWARKAHEIEKKFPGDGANFCTVWQRRAAMAVESRGRAAP